LFVCKLGDPCEVGPLSPRHGARPQVADGGDDLQIWKAAANTLNMQSRIADKEWSSSLGVKREANTHSNKYVVMKRYKKPRMDSFCSG
jgi:hypothetical protein